MLRLVLRQGLVLAVAGLGLGLAAAAVGRSVVSSICGRRGSAAPMRTLMITGGHGENSKCGYDYVPKKDLISGLQILFERGEFKIAKTLSYLEVLKIEMPAMEVMVTPSGNETLGAWRTGSMMTWCWRRWRARARYPDRLAGLDGNFVTPGLLRGRKGKRICWNQS